MAHGTGRGLHMRRRVGRHRLDGRPGVSRRSPGPLRLTQSSWAKPTGSSAHHRGDPAGLPADANRPYLAMRNGRMTVSATGWIIVIRENKAGQFEESLLRVRNLINRLQVRARTCPPFCELAL